jgi:DNA-binding transcriptional ArsR family regulator
MKLLKSDKTLHQKIFQMQCEICKSLGHPTRLQIVDLLNRSESSASDLISTIGISKGSLSKHMSLLLHGGIVESRREGRQIFYRLTDPEIHKACAIMRSILYRRLKKGEQLALAMKSAKADQ